ncbi:MAG: replication initiation protein [Candidatus Tectimicrobiota bacterium]
MNNTTALAKLPIPTGNPWLSSPEDPATIPVPLPVIIVSVEGPYTEQDRKLWTFLLHAVWDELGDKIIHEIPIREITRLFRDLRGRHHTDWIWESAERLADTKVRWIRTEGDKRYKGVGHLFSAETEDEVREKGTLRFNFPPLLIPILKDPRRFARLRTHFLIELSGKYSVTLYELLESVANKEVPELHASVEQLRQWLKVPEGKLLRWQDLRRYVLEPAVKQINDNPTGAGFRVRMLVVKAGRAINGVVFEVLKTKERQAFDAKLKDQEKQLHLFDVRLKTETYDKAKPLAPGWDIYVLEAEWKEWGSQQKDWPPQHPDAAFLGFCKQRGPTAGRR